MIDNMDESTIIQKARAGFDEDFSKKNYMEQRTRGCCAFTENS